MRKQNAICQNKNSTKYIHIWHNQSHIMPKHILNAKWNRTELKKNINTRGKWNTCKNDQMTWKDLNDTNRIIFEENQWRSCEYKPPLLPILPAYSYRSSEQGNKDKDIQFQIWICDTVKTFENRRNIFENNHVLLIREKGNSKRQKGMATNL